MCGKRTMDPRGNSCEGRGFEIRTYQVQTLHLICSLEVIRLRTPVIFCFGMLSFSPLVFLLEAFRKVEKA